MKKRYRVIEKILYISYILFLLDFLIFSDWYGRGDIYSEVHYNLVPFQEILRYWNYRDQLGMLSWANLLGNVVAFVPFGLLEGLILGRKNFLRTSLDGFLLSFIVEVFQLLFMVGSYDVDDLILNTAGAMLGYIIYVCCNTTRRVYDKNKKRA